jgi:HEPN domain-containing protein
MKNPALVKDYVVRCRARLKGLDVLYAEKAWADVVRESQEVVELALKALLRHAHIEAPRVHDVGDLLEQEKDALPDSARAHVSRLAKISRTLRRDRELAFYGSEDLTPSEFYKETDAKEARESARWVVERVSEACGI